MRRIMLVVFSLVTALMLATGTASAQEEGFVFLGNEDEEEVCDFFDLNDEDCFEFLFDEDFDDNFDGDEGFFDVVGDVGEVSQDVEQEAESGEVDQSFEVTGGGDNSNQCVSTQGVANTGNTQNVIDVVDTTGDFNDGDDGFFDFGDGDFEFDELESSIEVNPTSTTTCDNQVNQAAAASG